MKFINKEVFVVHKVEAEGDCKHATTYRMTRYYVCRIPVYTKIELLRKEEMK